jgi:hypothetical protein
MVGSRNKNFHKNTHLSEKLANKMKGLKESIGVQSYLPKTTDSTG